MVTYITVNKTPAVTDLNTCFKVDTFNYKLPTTYSVCVLLYGLITLVSFVTVCGNSLVIICVIYFKQLHTPTNTLVLSLAVADMLVGMVIFPLSIFFPLSSCLYNVSLFCKIRDSFDTLLSITSILHLCCISVDRYYAVCQPLTYRSTISGHVVIIMIAVSWGVSVLIAISVVTTRSNDDDCMDMCFVDVIMGNFVGPILAFYLPVVVMLCIYLKIFVVAQRQSRSIQTSTNTGATARKMERKATKTLAIVLGAFMFCWSPFFLFLTFQPLGNEPIPVPVIEAVTWLGLSNSTLNPFIYGFFYSWFKSAFKIVVSGKILKGNFVNSKLH